MSLLDELEATLTALDAEKSLRESGLSEDEKLFNQHKQGSWLPYEFLTFLGFRLEGADGIYRMTHRVADHCTTDYDGMESQKRIDLLLEEPNELLVWSDEDDHDIRYIEYVDAYKFVQDLHDWSYYFHHPKYQEACSQQVKEQCTRDGKVELSEYEDEYRRITRE